MDTDTDTQIIDGIEYRPFARHPGLLVGRDGSIKGPTGRTLKTSTTSTAGHHQVNARIPGAGRAVLPVKYYVHHMVAETWIGPRPDGQIVCHNDFDKDNNAAENLRYDTSANDRARRVAAGRIHRPRGSQNHNARVTAEQVREAHRLHREEGVGTLELARRYGLNRSSMGRILRGVAWTDIYAEVTADAA